MMIKNTAIVSVFVELSGSIGYARINEISTSKIKNNNATRKN